MKSISLKVKIIASIIIVFAIIVSIIACSTISRNNRIINDVTKIAQQHGLKDISVDVGSKISGYDFYSVTIKCSNLEDLSYSDMFALGNAMNVDDAFIEEYISNGDVYKIYPSSKSIYKNDNEIYDDYYNSSSYKSANKNGSKSSDNYSSKNKSSEEKGVDCEVCHRHYSYSDWDNCWSITYHGMCKKCHENYKWVKEAMEGLEQ